MPLTAAKRYPTAASRNQLQIVLADLAGSGTYTAGGAEVLSFTPLELRSLLANIQHVEGEVILAAARYELTYVKGSNLNTGTYKLWNGGAELANLTSLAGATGTLKIFLGRRVS